MDSRLGLSPWNSESFHNINRQLLNVVIYELLILSCIFSFNLLGSAGNSPDHDIQQSLKAH